MVMSLKIKVDEHSSVVLVVCPKANAPMGIRGITFRASPQNLSSSSSPTVLAWLYRFCAAIRIMFRFSPKYAFFLLELSIISQPTA